MIYQLVKLLIKFEQHFIIQLNKLIMFKKLKLHERNLWSARLELFKISSLDKQNKLEYIFKLNLSNLLFNPFISHTQENKKSHLISRPLRFGYKFCNLCYLQNPNQKWGFTGYLPISKYSASLEIQITSRLYSSSRIYRDTNNKLRIGNWHVLSKESYAAKTTITYTVPSRSSPFYDLSLNITTNIYHQLIKSLAHVRIT